MAITAFGAYAAIFLPYLPDLQGAGGPDYGYFLTQLLAGFFWFENNGLFSIPWFTPGFCGGIPYYANMQAMYLSLPQFLTFLVGPTDAIRLSFLLFAATGFAAFYALLRKHYAISTWVALAGGILFLFNGFYTYRMINGHLTFHAFMLAPLIVLASLEQGRGDAARRVLDLRVLDLWVLIAALLIAYMVQSGMVHAMPPSLVGIVVLILIHGALFGFSWIPFARLATACTVALALSAAKLVAALAFMEHFPREMLPLSGFEGLGNVVVLAVKSLFVAPAFLEGATWIRNNAWYEDMTVNLAYHEFEYGVTILPAIIIGAWLLLAETSPLRRTIGWKFDRRAVLFSAAGVLLALPIFLNWYEPSWNAFLKGLPFFRNSFTLVRWFCLYIMISILAATLIVERLRVSPQLRSTLALVIVALTVLHNAKTDRTYYQSRNTYDFATVDRAYSAVRSGATDPAINRIDWAQPGDQPWTVGRDRNDSIATGGSQGQCYEPMFGHRLEDFPFGQLREGDVLATQNGVLNVKNPACMIYPEANSCQPGDHFRVAEIDEARRFLSYRPFRFVVPAYQRIANTISLATLAAVLIIMGILALRNTALIRLSVRAQRGLRSSAQ